MNADQRRWELNNLSALIGVHQRLGRLLPHTALENSAKQVFARSFPEGRLPLFHESVVGDCEFLLGVVICSHSAQHHSMLADAQPCLRTAPLDDSLTCR